MVTPLVVKRLPSDNCSMMIRVEFVHLERGEATNRIQSTSILMRFHQATLENNNEQAMSPSLPYGEI